MLVAALTFSLLSPGVSSTGALAPINTCVGIQPAPYYRLANMSPELHWAGAPAGTQSYVVTMVDSDARNRMQWLVFDILSPMQQMPQGYTAHPPARFGRNSAGTLTYLPPCPQYGHTDRYVITLYALDTPRLNVTGAAPGAIQVLAAMNGHIVGRAVLNTYFANH
jgi:Raf kinase inhibitor-like YbhB/YbcL family protein